MKGFEPPRLSTSASKTDMATSYITSAFHCTSERSRTVTPLGTRPSNVPVCQFQHTRICKKNFFYAHFYLQKVLFLFLKYS